MKQIYALTKDILIKVNQTIWGGAEGVEKVATIVKGTI